MHVVSGVDTLTSSQQKVNQLNVQLNKVLLLLTLTLHHLTPRNFSSCYAVRTANCEDLDLNSNSQLPKEGRHEVAEVAGFYLRALSQS